MSAPIRSTKSSRRSLINRPDRNGNRSPEWDRNLPCNGFATRLYSTKPYCWPNWRTAISDDPKDDEERPCLHCLLVDTIDNFFADYPVSEDEPNAIDSDEIVTALAKVVAEMTCSMEGADRQQLIERLMQDVMEYDAEFRQQDQLGTAVSGSRH